MLLCRVSAVSQTLARWGRRSHRGGGLVHRALLFSSGRCHGVSSGEGSARPTEAGSAQTLYRDTVLLPRTEFPMKLTGQKLLDRELEIQKVRRTMEADDPPLKISQIKSPLLVDSWTHIVAHDLRTSAFIYCPYFNSAGIRCVERLLRSYFSIFPSL